MIKILVSNFFHYHKDNGIKVANKLDNSNGIVDHIKSSLKNNNLLLFIASDPNNKEKVKAYSSLLFEAFSLSGITFKNYIIVDSETIVDKIDEYVKKADMIFLSGGSTYIQNEFFKKINLSDALCNYDGLVLGQSAGAINVAIDAFNSPEELEESEPIHFKGLGLTDINIEPHFVFDDSNFDEKQKYQRKAILEESYKHDLYGQCDGSHILIDENNNINIYGETYLIKNGQITLI